MNVIYFKAYVVLSAALLMNGTMVGMEGFHPYLQTGEIVLCHNPIEEAHEISQELLNDAALQNRQDPYHQKLVEACDAFNRNQTEYNAKAVNHAYEISQTAYYLAATKGKKETWARLLAHQEKAARERGFGHVIVTSK